LNLHRIIYALLWKKLLKDHKKMNLNSFGSPMLHVSQINALITENEDLSSLTSKSYFGTLMATFILFVLTVGSFLVVWLLFQEFLLSGYNHHIP